MDKIRVIAKCNMYEGHVNITIGTIFEVTTARAKALGDAVEILEKVSTPEIERPKAKSSGARNRMVAQAPETA